MKDTLPINRTMKSTVQIAAGLVVSLLQGMSNPVSAAPLCSAQSGPTRVRVVELYTSEGCNSCPPADEWLSTFKASQAQSGAVIQAFHVGYWNYIGWVDRFASPAHITRQRKIASLNRLTSIYTPQAVRDGRDWPDWHRAVASSPGTSKESALVSIQIREVAQDQFEALVLPLVGATGAWSAYWTVTEHGHNSKFKSGKSAGELLRLDYVVRQYTPAGDYAPVTNSPQKLTFRTIAFTPGHPRQINLVLYDPKSGKTLLALSASC